MRIGLDLDGVIANIRTETGFRYVRDFGNKEWNKVKNYLRTSDAPGVPDGWMRKQFEDKTFWLNAIAFEDGYYMSNKWFSEGHDVYIITARYPGEMDVTERWLEEWDIIVTDLISQPINEKHKLVDKLHLDLFVEDNPEEAKIIAEKIPSLLIDACYNDTGDGGDAIRINDLYDVDKVVQQWPRYVLNAQTASRQRMLMNLLGNTSMTRRERRG